MPKIIWGINVPVQSKRVIGWNNHENPNWYEDCLKNPQYEDYIKIVPEMSFRLCEECGSQLVGRRLQYDTCSPEHNKKKWERIKESERHTNGIRPHLFWDSIRNECFNTDERKCMKCGQPEYQRFFDYTDKWLMFITKTIVTNLHAHHIKRIADGGDNTLDNLITLCEECHKKEHSKDKNTEKKHITLDKW